MRDPVLDAIEHLFITNADDSADALIVDAHWIMGDNDVRYWRLVETMPGIWRHAPSDTKGSLGQMLRGIAQTYLDSRAARKRAGLEASW